MDALFTEDDFFALVSASSPQMKKSALILHGEYFIQLIILVKCQYFKWLWYTLLEQKVAKSRNLLKIFGTKSSGTKSRVEVIVAQNLESKSRGNLMSRKIQKLKVAGT